MTFNEAARQLEEEGVPPDAYAINRVGLDDTYTLSEEGTYFEVYYCERGSKVGLRKFATETEACEYFVPLVLSVTKRHAEGD